MLLLALLLSSQASRDTLRYVTFGIGTVTLEDVFLKVAAESGGGGHGGAAAASSAIGGGALVSASSTGRGHSIQDAPSEAAPLLPAAAAAADDEPRDWAEAASRHSGSSFGSNMHALLLKRWHNSKRDKKGLCCQVQ
jgi:hypothetical protein